jgi:hypothetical protein
MTALADNYLDMLKRELTDHYVSHLPPLLNTTGTTPQQQAEKQISRAFSAFVLNKRHDVSPPSAAMSVVDDFNDSGVDAIYYDQKSESLYLVQSKLKASEQFAEKEALAFCNGVRLLLKQDFATFNKNVLARQTEIENALGTCSSIKLLIAYTGSGISQHATTALEQLLSDDDLDEERLEKAVELFTPIEIAQALLEQQAYKPVNAEIDLTHFAKLEQPRTTYYGVIKVSALVNLHRQHGKALYEKNIRYFLGSRNSNVNRDIQRTLKTEPESFFYLNNGVTALCNSIEPKGKTKQGAKKLRVRGLSIINGAQTVASAAEVMQQPSPPDISEAKVLLTVIKANAEGMFGPKVTRARNHQNTVSPINFASLDPDQERLRQELAYYNIKYHYRPEASVIPDDNNILLQEAITALSWLQPDPRFAVWLKGTPATINDANSENYKTIFRNGLPGVSLANAVFYSRGVHNLGRAADRGSSGIERLTYRHGINAIGWVFIKRVRDRIQSTHLITPAAVNVQISQPFDELRQQSSNQFRDASSSKGPLAFFKNQTDAVPYLANLMEQNYKLAAHQALPSLKAAAGNEAFPRERLFNFMSQQAPQI